MEPGALVSNRFRIVALAGKGGFGTVYQALDEDTQRRIALKVFDRAQADLPRFEREAHLLGLLRHPRIVEFIAHGYTDGGTGYIAMEWLEGCDLEQRLRGGELSIAQTLRLGLRAAEGLAAAHTRGLVHRDIKPSNIFLVDGDPECLRLLDFGIARKQDDESKLTQTGAIVGTPGYMAPEQAMGSRELTPRVDVFALGCVLFECLTGGQAIVGRDAGAVLSRTLHDPVPRLSHWMPNAPRGLDSLLARMMARDPLSRFPDGAATVLAIAEVIANPATTTLPDVGVAAVSADTARIVSRLLVSGDAYAIESAREGVGAFGGEIDRHDERLLGVRFALDNAAEMARRAVICGLTLVSADSSLKTVVLSARNATPPSPASDAAAALALDGLAAECGKVLVDASTATLLSESFEIQRKGAAAWVSGYFPAAPLAHVFLGRSRELASLDGAFLEVSDESCARAVVVQGEAGIGKTQLLESFIGRLRSRGTHFTLLRAQADRPTGCSPFELARMLVRQCFAAHAQADDSERGLVEELLAQGMSRVDAETIRLLTRAEPVLTSGAVDPVVLADRLRCAWLSLLDLQASRSPLLLWVEDVHQADAASLRLLAACLTELSVRPILVLCSTRPGAENALESLAAELLVLQPLRPALAAELLATLYPRLTPTSVDRIVQRAGGNPFRLRDLGRSYQEGGGQAGLDVGIAEQLGRLPPLVSRVLRAGSVFGLQFAIAGLQRLLGAALSPTEMDDCLATALDAGIVLENRDGSGAPLFTFSHPLLQETAYSQLTELDARAAHRAAGSFLASAPGANPSVVAWHFERAQDPELALPWFEAATRAALVGGEPARAAGLAEQALAGSVDSERCAAIGVLRAEAAVALADTGGALRSAEQALTRASSGNVTWVRAATLAINAAGQRGQNDDVYRLGKRVLAVQAATEEAQAARVICLCQVATQLVGAGRLVESDEFAAAVSRASSTRPEAQAAVLHVEASRAILGHNLELGALSFAESARLHALSGNPRASALLRIFRTSALLWMGDAEAAHAEVDAAEALARRAGATYYVRWARYARGKILALGGDAWVARDQLSAVRKELQGSPRIVAGTHIFAALAALRVKDAAWATNEAQMALLAHQSSSVQAVGRALLARSEVLQGLHAEAIEHALEAHSLLDRAGGIEENEGVIRLALPEALEAGHRLAEARSFAEAAVERLFTIAAKFSSSQRREAYLNGDDTHVATLRLAHRLGIPVLK